MLSGPLPDNGPAPSAFDRFDDILTRVLNGVTGVTRAVQDGRGPAISTVPAVYGPAPAAANNTGLIVVVALVVLLVVLLNK